MADGSSIDTSPKMGLEAKKREIPCLALWTLGGGPKGIKGRTGGNDRHSSLIDRPKMTILDHKIRQNTH